MCNEDEFLTRTDLVRTYHLQKALLLPTKKVERDALALPISISTQKRLHRFCGF